MFVVHAAAMALPALVPLPEYNPGDAFVFSDGRVERVIAADGDRMTWASLSGPTYERSRNFIIPVLSWRRGRGTGTREIRGNPDALWPVKASQSVRFRVIAQTRTNPQAKTKRSVSMWMCKTSKPRAFTVAAGTFDAIPVLCDRYSSISMRLIERREWDYSPEVGHYIRRVTVNYVRGTSRSIELVAALTGPAASPARLAAIARNARTAATPQSTTGEKR